jgi:hypothetical protein
MYELFTRWMRTAVPLLAGYILTATETIGVHPDTTATTALVTALVTGVYYTVFGVIEHLADRVSYGPLRVLAGVLLGWARPPQTTGGGDAARRVV